MTATDGAWRGVPADFAAVDAARGAWEGAWAAKSVVGATIMAEMRVGPLARFERAFKAVRA